MKRNTRTAVVLMMAALAIQGCASVVSTSSYPVAVSSTPSGATFEILDKKGDVVHVGNTPSTVTLRSGNGYFSGQTYTLRFKKDGYPEKAITLDSSISGWYWGNILLGGVIGMLVVDPMTGAMYNLPKQASVDLNDPLANASTGSLEVATIEALSAAERERLMPLH